MKNQNKTKAYDEIRILPITDSKESEGCLRENLGQQGQEKLQKRHSIATTRRVGNLDENRIQLDGFTCNVSLKDVTSFEEQTPIQFSFTLYDVDGCGKITKDDIAGIVSTIYENIGNSVVVPHYGKKTINVKLTVSSDIRHQQKMSTNEPICQNHAGKKPRAFLSDDDDVEESETASENLTTLSKMQNLATSGNKLSKKITIDKNNVYESINNLKYSNQTQATTNLISSKNMKNIKICKSCKPNHTTGELHLKENDEIDNKQLKISSKKKALKKYKSKKHRVRLRKKNYLMNKLTKFTFQTSEARMRSLSVGNDQKWRKQQEMGLNQEQTQDCLLNQSNNLRRKELIEIIKDSLEKNCFQTRRYQQYGQN